MNERPTLTITVLLFAQARERAGTARETLELPAGSRVSDALGVLESRHPELATLRDHLAIAGVAAGNVLRQAAAGHRWRVTVDAAGAQQFA